MGRFSAGIGHDQEVTEEHHAQRDGVGIAAFLLGLLAVVCALVPVIGEVIALVPSVAAIGLGILGVRRHEQGHAAKAGLAVAGALCGGLALAIIGLIFAMSHMP